MIYRKNQTTRNSCILGLITLVLTQVSLGQKLSRTDLAKLYDEYRFTDLAAVVYHTSDTTSTVYVNIPLHDLAYEENDAGLSEARFRIRSFLYESYNDKNPVETQSMTFQDTLWAGQEMNMAVDFDIGARYPEDYTLMIELTDLVKPEHQVSWLTEVRKTSRFTQHCFLILENDDYPLFSTHFSGNKRFRIRYNNPDSIRLHVRYYNQSFPLAKPPFALDKNILYSFEPDSFYTVPMEEGLTPLLELPYPGIYHVQAHRQDPDGITLFRYSDGFPEISAPLQALSPLRYLTTEREFETLSSYQDVKTAIDSFWLERASYNPERAKNMIRKYYQRVEASNRLFSSFHEGWKTDRGLLYIIYGPPSEVYRPNNEEEEWIYGERGNPMSIRFYFYKLKNPFSEEDYSLQRSPIYKTSWYIAIENWRR